MDKKEVDFKDLLLSNMYEIEAIIRILEKKGILTHEEVLKEIKILKAENMKHDNLPEN